MNLVPITSKIDHLRPERQHMSVLFNGAASYRLDCETLGSRLIANIPLGASLSRTIPAFIVPTALFLA
jgi:hypothetical protein